MPRAIPACLCLLAVASTASLSARADVTSVAPLDTAGLIAALDYANRTPGEHVIELAGKSLYTLTGAAPGNPGQGLPTLRGHVRILGNGSEIRRYSAEPLLLMTVAESGSVRLEHLTLAEGDRGAIVNRGKLRLHHVHLVDNTAHGAEAILSNYGELLVADGSVIAHNEIAGAQRDAGIVLNYGSIEMRQSSFDANWVSRRFGTLAEASALLNYGRVSLSDVTLRENAAEDDEDAARVGTVLNLGNGTLEAQNVVLSDNRPPATNILTGVIGR